MGCTRFFWRGSQARVAVFSRSNPPPKIYPWLTRNVGLNGWNHVKCLQKAVSSANGRMYFDTGAGTAVGHLSKDQTGIEVETVTLDSLVDAGFPPPDMIKVDVEGAESLVLAGAMGVLRKYRPVLLVELHNPDEDVAVELCSPSLATGSSASVQRIRGTAGSRLAESKGRVGYRAGDARRIFRGVKSGRSKSGLVRPVFSAPPASAICGFRRDCRPAALRGLSSRENPPAVSIADNRAMPLLERFVDGRFLVPDHARQQARHRIHHHGSSQFAAAQHVIADRKFVVRQMFGDPFIHAFIPAADQQQFFVCEQLPRCFLGRIFGPARKAE